MLAYILGITKRGNKSITNRDRFQGLQIEARGITNRGSLRDFKSGEKVQIGAEISNRGKEISSRGRDYKSGQGLQIGSEQLSGLSKVSLVSVN